MKVISHEDMPQNSEQWLEWRRPNIGGSNTKDIKPLSRGPLKGLPEGSAGFWRLTSGKISIQKDGEPDMERGHRMEAENLLLTNEKLGLKMVQIGAWISEYSDYIYISPDAGDYGDKPVHAFESKAFDTHKHLNIIWNDIQAKKKDDYNPLLSLPSDNQDQAVKYFNVAPTLEYLHWSMLNELVAYDFMEHYIITIKREDVEELLDAQREIELAALKRRDEVIDELIKELSPK